MKQTGITQDGRAVVTGVFRMFDTHGLPLDIVFDLCKQKNLQPSWVDFYREAKAGGWKHETILSRLGEALNDVYGKEYRDVVLSRLNEASV